MKYQAYVPESYMEWKAIVEEELGSSARFEIHCWNEEAEETEAALKFGHIKECGWSCGKAVEGAVSEEFKEYILNCRPQAGANSPYDKHTPFFSIFLDSGFSSEHYGTELNKP